MCGCNRAQQASINRSRGSGLSNRIIQQSESSLPTVDTSIWGPPTWIALHIASIVSSQNIPLWKELLYALLNDIPCPDCRAHYSEWLQNHPIHTPRLLPIRRLMGKRSSSQLKIIPWLLNLHNDVNSRLDPPTPIWNEQQVMERYGGDRVAEGRAALETVRGILGGTSFDILMRLLG